MGCQIDKKERKRNRANVYGDHIEQVTADEFDDVEIGDEDEESLVLGTHQNAYGQGSWKDFAGSEGEQQFAHKLLSEYEVPMSDNAGGFVYACDVVLFHLGFLTIESSVPLVVRLFGPEQMSYNVSSHKEQHQKCAPTFFPF